METTLDDLEITLKQDDTLRYYLCGNKFDFTSKITHRLKFICAMLAIALVTLGILLDTKSLSCLLLSLLLLIILIAVLLECNYLILIQSLTIFDTYYKTINIMICVIAFQIDTNAAKDSFTDSNDNYIARQGWCSIMVINSGLSVFLVSIVDGYYLTHKQQIFIILMPILYYLFRFLGMYFDFFYWGLSREINILGEKVYWHTIEFTTLINTLAFLMKQLFSTIRHPNKLIAVAFNAKLNPIQLQKNVTDKLYLRDLHPNELIQLQQEHSNETKKHISATIDIAFSRLSTGTNSNSDTITKTDINCNDDNSAKTITAMDSLISEKTSIEIYRQKSHLKAKDVLSLNFSVEIDTKQTVLNKIWKNSNIIMYKIHPLFSKATVTICAFYVMGFILISMATDEKLEPEIQGICNIFSIICTIWILLHLNYWTAKFLLKQFVFWWKMQNILTILIVVGVIDYHNKVFLWRYSYSSSSDQVWPWTVHSLYVINGSLGMCVVLLVNGFVLTRLKYGWYKYIPFILIIIAQMFMVRLVFEYFTHGNHDYTFHLRLGFIESGQGYGYDVSCRTIVDTKCVDITIWLATQFFNQIRYADGIPVYNRVNKKWITMESKSSFNNKDNNKQTLNFPLLPIENKNSV